MSIEIFQIYFAPEHLRIMDPAFVPFDNAKDASNGWCEYGVFAEQHAAHCNSSNYAGYLSWRFGQKTGWTGQDLLQCLQSHPGYDVYYINPYPVGSLYQNIWYQLDLHQPGILKVAQHIFDALRIDVNLATLVQPAEEITFSNYWIGNGAFWRRYMAFSLPVQAIVDESLPKELGDIVERRVKYGLTLRPFIMEGVFSTFLTLNRLGETGQERVSCLPVAKDLVAFDTALDDVLKRCKALASSSPQEKDGAQAFQALHHFLALVECNGFSGASPLRILTDRKLQFAQRLLQRLDFLRPFVLKARALVQQAR